MRSVLIAATIVLIAGAAAPIMAQDNTSAR